MQRPHKHIEVVNKSRSWSVAFVETNIKDCIISQQAFLGSIGNDFYSSQRWEGKIAKNVITQENVRHFLIDR